jgi:glycosyltransferase involved in cell wall biosynthesis
VRLVPEGEVQALADALVHVIENPAVWQDLHAANLKASREHIAWDHIADRFLDGLRA